MDLFNKKLRVGIFTGALLLAGCGGGGGDEGSSGPTPTPPPATNSSPTVSQATVEDVLEQEALTLNATASDSDGSIASYSWSHDASFEFTSSGLNTAEATFTSPDITEDVTVKFTVTVTDDDGATASSTQEVLIKRKVSNVTITGIVTDEPIANAELEIVVGSESFNVQAGDDGRYTAVLNIDESSAKKLVRVKAKGLDTLNPGVEFVSQLSSVEKLLAQAGDDKTLDSNDNFGVNITNVTTAEFALLTRDGKEPASEAELDSALLNVDADEKIQLATLIKIIVDNPDYSLPEGVNSTLELVANEQVAKQFEEEVIEKDPEIIEKTKKEIKEDDDLVTGATGSLEGNYIINSPRYHTNTAFHLSLMADGSGEFSANTSSAITWSENEGVYTLAFDKQVTIYQNSDAESSESLVLTGLSFIVLAENDVFRTIEITRSTERMIVDRNSGSVTKTTEEDETYTTNLIYKNKTISLLAEQLIGEWAFHAYENDYDTSDDPDLPETLQFYADGTGDVGGNSSEAFTWQLNNHSLTVNYDEDGETGQLDLWFTKALSGGYQLVGLDTSFDEPSDTLTGLLIKKQAVTITNEDLIGRWHGFIGTAQSYDLNIYSDGTTMIGLGVTNWQGHLEDGQFTRKRFIYNNEVVTSCEGFNASCYLESEMIHEFISIVDNLFYINRTLNYYLPNGEISSQDGAILVYEYSKDLSYSAFTEELLENYTEFYSADGQTDRVYAEYDENGNVTYAVELESQTYTGATFNDGVLSYDRNGEKWHFELVSSDTDSIVVCHYKDGGTCNAASQITYLPKRPKVTLTANSNGNGEISPASQASFFYQKVGFEIIPSDGFILDAIEGCDGYVEGNHYIALAGNMDCEINATFKEQQETVGTFIIGNQDLYYASAYTVELSEDNTGALTYEGKVEVTWTESAEGVIEITPQSDFVLQEYESFSNSIGMNVATKDIATKLTLTPLPEKGSNWYELGRDIEQYQDDVLVDEYTSSYEVSKTTLEQRLAINANDMVGEWSVNLVGENTVYKVFFNDDGTGVSHNISDLSDESFTWQVADNTMVLNFPEDGGIESFYVTKDINVGYQLVTQGIFDSEHYTDSGIMVRRNEQAISADNFAGRHQFRDGHDINSHWAEVQIYQDGEVFFTTGTSSYQKGFEDGHLIRDLYYDTTDGNWQRVDWCDVALDTCHLAGKFVYTLVAVDGDRYYIERTITQGSSAEETTAHLYIHDYSPSTKVDQFYEYDLGFRLYQNDGNGTVEWFVRNSDYDEEQDKQYYTLRLDNADPVNVELIDGKLELILDGQDTVIELIDNNRRDITFCKYLKGNSCQVGDEVYLSFDAPELTITVNSDGNGSLAVGDESIVEHGSNWSTSIEPNSGYELDSISGCDGYVDGSDYRISYVKESCQIDVTFKEFVPLSTQANITDPALAMCVDNSGETSLESVTELNCSWNIYGEVTSLAGLEALPNLQTLELANLNIGTHLDLSALEQLTEFSNGYNYGSEQQTKIESIQFYDSSLITRLELSGQNISDIDLSAYTSLQDLTLQDMQLTQIDLSNQTQLVHLDLQGTELNQLDLTFNTQLESLWLNSGSLTELNIGHLTELRDAFLWGQTGVTELDVTNLTKLTRLNIGKMGVASLNLINLVNLLDLGIEYTSINNLDFSALQSLSSLNVEGVEQPLVPWSHVYHISSLTIGGANYTSFDFSPFTNLTRLRISDSGVSDLSSIANPDLILSLDLFYNYQLEQLNISEMTSLNWLQVNDSSISTLDFSNNSNLTNVYIKRNALETISGIEAIADKSARLDFDNNPLSSVTISYLDDLRDNQGYYNISYSVSYSVTVNVTGNGTASDSNFTLSDGESRGLYLYPDSGYEVDSIEGCEGTWHSADYYEVGPITESCEINVEFVEAIPLADKAGITDPALAQCANNSGYTHLEFTTSLNCYSGDINSLDGLEAFPNLNGLHVVNLNVGEVPDLSRLTALTNITINNSSITGIMVYDSNLIERIGLSGNALTSFDASPYSNLKELDLQNNQLVSLDTTNNTLLGALSLNVNPLTNLVINSAYLLDLRVSHTELTGLDLRQSVELDYLDISHTPELAGLDLSHLTKLRELNISGLDQSLINNAQFPSVESLFVSYANLTSFDTTGLANLKYLNLEGNQISDFSQVIIDKPAQLLDLNILQNPLIELDVSQFSNLTSLNINETNITNLDFTNNITLKWVYANRAKITTVTGIEFLTENRAFFLDLHNNPLSNDTVSYLDDLRDNQGYYNISYSVSYSVTVNVAGNGSVSDSNFLLSDGESRGLYLYPDSGYEVASVTGCDGTWYSADYYEVGPLTSSCEIDVEFVEATSLAEKAGITDPVLAECVNNSGYTRLEDTTSLNCAWSVNGEITSLVGLDAFPNLEQLRVSELNLGGGDIDLSQYSSLKMIGIYNSALTSLIVNDPNVITELSLNSNKLSEIDLSAYTNLQHLELSQNELTSIDLSQNLRLNYLSISSNALSEIDLSNNVEIINLSVDDNALTYIDLNNNINIESLNISFNQLTSLGLTSLTKLVTLSAESNLITSIDLTQNTLLHAVFLSYNQLSEVDLSQQALLVWVHISNNDLTEVHLSQNALLTSIQLSHNQLSVIDLSSNNKVSYLDLSSNLLTEIEISHLSQLEYLHAHSNQLAVIDVGNANELKGLHIGENELTELNLEANLELTYLAVWGNSLASIDLSNNTELRSVSVGNNLLTSIDLSNNINIDDLDIDNNQLNTVDLTSLSKLVYLNAQANLFTSIDISSNTELVSAYFSNNQLQQVDTSNNTLLTYLSLDNNEITDVSGLEYVVNKAANINLKSNNLSAAAVSYIQGLRDGQGYTNILFDMSVAFNVTGSGSVGEESFSLSENETRDIYLYPDTGYEIGSVTGCDGTLETDYYSVGPLTASCEVNVEFVETTP